MAQPSKQPLTETFDDYNTQLQGAALKATRYAATLPFDIPFHRSIDRDFAREVDACSSQVLSLTNKLLALASTASPSQSARVKGKARLQVEDDVVDNFHSLVVDTMDQLLERADISLDEFLGRSKPPAIAVNPIPVVQKTKKANVPQGRLDPALQHASHLPKPQLEFKRKHDNSNYTRWNPTLRHKYNAQVPLGYSYQEDGEDSSSTSLHPYRYEIRHISYPSRMFSSAPPVSSRSFEATPFTWVATSEAFSLMLGKLRSASEIAVDLEYHSYRTFGGFVCLMQISTRKEDWVVDTLALREEMEELNEVFTNPQIVKVLHGAESDVVWLQQDFNLYIVNLFDTYHASKVLDFPRHGLATLLEMYCDFTADKRYQLADWRIRPLPQEMLQYARSDTHFLLYIYDNLRNALLDRAQSRSQTPAQGSSSIILHPAETTQCFVREVLSRSEETALRVYEKEIYDAEAGMGPGGWDTLARKWNKTALMAGPERLEDTAINLQREVYRCVHAWRDRIAREEDESTRYVLPNHYLFSLAERPPADMAALLSVFRPVPPVMRRRAKELLDAIRETVKRQLGTSSSSAIAATTDELEHVNPESAKLMDVDEKVSTDDVASLTLWSSVSRSSASAQSSSLFGPSLLTKADIAGSLSYVASQSLLFGPYVSGTRQSSDVFVNKSDFCEAMARIHSTLIITPSIPKIALGISSRPDITDDTGQLGDNILQLPVELPFVPASQRAGVKAEVVDDSIVIVGQARQKKRKRAEDRQKKPATAESAQEKADTGGEGSAAEPFDYSGVSNILDDEGSDHEPEQRGRKKKQKQGRAPYQYGGFSAPPKAHSQLKSGNQSPAHSHDLDRKPWRSTLPSDIFHTCRDIVSPICSLHARELRLLSRESYSTPSAYPHASISLAMTSANYIPLAQFPPSLVRKAKAAGYATSYFARRRALLATVIVTSLVTLLVFFEYALRDVDLEDSDLDLLPTNITVDVPSVLASYVPFEPATYTTAVSSRPSLIRVHDLPRHCLDPYFTSGELCYDSRTVPPMDVLWTWVNGSDVLLQKARAQAVSRYSKDDPYCPANGGQERMWRDHDELRHSMRSVLANFRSHANRFRLLTSDFPIPTTTPNLTLPASWRLGQIPQWLHREKQWSDRDIRLSITHHADIFNPYIGTTFNSYAIESQFSHLEDITENFIYMNDDFFMASPLSPTSFYTSAYGLVLRMQPDLMVSSDKPTSKTKGEWRSMGETNYLLSKRFGIRSRPYVAHEAKAVSRALLQEISLIWTKKIAETASHPFRETVGGEGDFNMLFALSHFIVERAREALLWSWTVGRIGALDDTWGVGESEVAWTALGGIWGEQTLAVHSSARATVDKERVRRFLADSGHTGASKTSYHFSSLDGYPYAGLDSKYKKDWPSFSLGVQPTSLPSCSITYHECFAVPGLDEGTARASAVFKNIAYDKPRCGDCVIMALVGASGSLGLSAFLPARERVLPSLAGKIPDGETDIAYLPLVDDWRDGDFSLREVMHTARQNNVRDWTLQLLQRYRYIIGDTPSMFERITSPNNAKSVLKKINNNPDVALLCINDDVAVGDNEVATILKEWQDRRWNHSANWEAYV
ncbi:Exosome complex exonuclease rrp6 [Grifola frondosa]|uniref:Exosome complex exonuclease rrp6 n=1 Tax=Grifola frondosa TaxID=5627 RepID=A0A1C7M379_GRIFR|nr:Exosome complex exonuclease rrp6 [Grifola frondosa]